MFSLADYDVLTELHRSDRTLVFRARRRADGMPVILKTAADEFPDPSVADRLRREFAIVNALDSPRIVRTHGLEDIESRPVLTLEDFGGQSLRAAAERFPFSIAESLDIAVAILSGLAALHRANVIHKDLTPANVVINRADGTVKIIDFGIATTVPREHSRFAGPADLEGTLPYVSPEQTGRMNRRIDYRTDFYSLGVTLYELLTGVLPFTSNDPLEIVYGHLAVMPPPPGDLNRDVPPTVSGVVMKLLAKNAEDRYQSAEGVLADLTEARRQLRETGQVKVFAPGIRDVSPTPRLPEKRYGREVEAETLRAAFERARLGPAETVFVTGGAGLGKTALAQDLYPDVTRRQGVFGAGTFERFQRNVPYSAVIQAFRSIIRHALTESETRVAAYRERLSAALGVNAGVVTAVIPELEIILGAPPPVPELPLLEAGNRFRLVFRQFVAGVATEEQPLVVFLDDAHWADQASLALVGDLMTDAELRHVLFIAAYREGESEPGDPIRVLTHELAAAGARLTTLALSPLSRAAMRAFVADTLGGGASLISELTALVHRKTGGNPFFAAEFLKKLFEEGLVSREEGVWKADFDAIRSLAAAENVVDFLAGNLRRLQPAVLRSIETAACLGLRFSVARLARIEARTEAALRLELVEASAADLVVGEIGGEWFSFVHDRIRQAAYSLIPEKDRPMRHLAAGRVMATEAAETDDEQPWFAVADHLNLGAAAMTDPVEREALAALNLRVGKAAKAASAFAPGLAYLETGLAVLNGLTDAPWETHPDLMLTLNVEIIEAAYLATAFNRMEDYVSGVLNHLPKGAEAIRVWETVMLADFARYRFADTVAMGRRVLADLGVVFPDHPTPPDLAAAFAQVEEKLAGKSIEDLVHLPEMTDPTALAASRILHRVAVAAYFTSPELMILLTLKRLLLLLDHGNMAFSAGVYGGYAAMLCGQLGRIDDGVRFGNLAMKMAERPDARATRARTFFVVGWFARVWEHHLRESLEPLLEAYRCGLETGEFEFASAGLLARMEMKFALGEPLVGLETEIAEQYEAVARLRQERHALAFSLFRQCVANLTDRSDAPWNFAGPWADEAALIPALTEKGDTATLGTLAFLKLFLNVLFNRRAEAVTDAELTLRNFHAIRATCLAPRFALLDSLAQLGRLSGDPATDAEIFARLDDNRKKLDVWARHAPMNFEHLLRLHDAERCRVAGRAAGALDHYDRAVELARANGFLQDEGMANELAADFFIGIGKPKLARVYAQEARYAYLRWGALAKVRQVDEHFAGLMNDPEGRRSGSHGTAKTTDTAGGAFDFASVMKAAQALSGEIRLDQLLNGIMRIALENAGAQRGLLLLPDRHGVWRIEAENDALVERVRVLHSEPPREGENLPVAVVNFVARTGESVLLDDAPGSREFGDDAYIRAVAPRSVLCLPVLHQGKLTAMLYLENRLMANVFTPQRREVLNLLTAQAAVSLQNARLYADLEAKVRERTAELEEKTTQLLDSLRYAERIQQAILPSESALRAVLPESFVIWKPKDIVSGDFYWAREIGGELVIAVADCTGHGVPGALMAMIGDALLEQIVVEKKVTDPARILTRLHVGINRALKREGAKEEVFESMDIALIRLGRHRRSVTFAGARRSLYFTGPSGDIREIKGDRVAVGSGRRGGDRRFTAHEIEVEHRTVFYLVTDGFTDQNNLAGMKFGVQRLRKLFAACAPMPMAAQAARIEREFANHRGNEPQRDDVTVFGFVLGEQAVVSGQSPAVSSQ
jgi:predicted ATPase/serine phosphatase RsbU (regulator of sigma subunit)